MTERKEVSVEYFDITFEVRGEWVPYSRGKSPTFNDPGEPPDGGYFEEYEIFHAGDNFTGILADEDEIIRLASEKLL